MGAATRSENSFIFDEHTKYYRRDVLAIYDRLHADYSVIAFHAKKGIDFLIRCPLKSTFREVDEFVKSGLRDKVVTLKVTRGTEEVRGGERFTRRGDGETCKG
jgi:hypothetical protein